MIYVLKIIWDYWVSLLELIIRNIARYPQSATSTSIRYQPAIRYLLPCLQPLHVLYDNVTFLYSRSILLHTLFILCSLVSQVHHEIKHATTFSYHVTFYSHFVTYVIYVSW
jgi:hypothetical protein